MDLAWYSHGAAGGSAATGENEMRRCFVISPIGEKDSPERSHADKVFRHIIAPAMREAQIEPIRGDHHLTPGKISDQVIRSVLEEQLCIAVLTGHNPNVFYELAIAQCAGRPVIMMIHKQEPLPFDVADYRCVKYDFDPDAIADGVYAQELIGHVRAFEQCGWAVPALLPEPSPRIPNVLTARNNGELAARIRRYIKAQKEAGKPPRMAKVIQFSGEKSKEILALLLDAGINVELYLGQVDFPRWLGNQHQVDRIVANRFSKLKNEVMPNGLKAGMGSLQLFRYSAPASIRAVLIDEGFVALGGYVYMMYDLDLPEPVLDIRGAEKPMFIVQAGHPDFPAVTDVVRDTIGNWRRFQMIEERDESTDFPAREKAGAGG